jgi:hypothetical protein
MLGLKEGFFLLGLGAVLFAFNSWISASPGGNTQCCLALLSLAGIGLIILGYYALHKRKEKLKPELKKGYELGSKGLIILCILLIISILFSIGMAADILELAKRSDATYDDLFEYIRSSFVQLSIISFLASITLVVTVISPTLWKKDKAIKIMFIIGIILIFVPAIANHFYGIGMIDEIEKEYRDEELNDDDTLIEVLEKYSENDRSIYIGLIGLGYLILSVPNFLTCTEYDFEKDEMEKIIDQRRNRLSTYRTGVRLPLAPYQKYQRRIVPTLSSSPQRPQDRPPPGPGLKPTLKSTYRPSAQTTLRTYAYGKPKKQMSKTKQIPLKTITQTTAPRSINKMCASCKRTVDSKFPFCPYCGKKI